MDTVGDTSSSVSIASGGEGFADVTGEGTLSSTSTACGARGFTSGSGTAGGFRRGELAKDTSANSESMSSAVSPSFCERGDDTGNTACSWTFSAALLSSGEHNLALFPEGSGGDKHGENTEKNSESDLPDEEEDEEDVRLFALSILSGVNVDITMRTDVTTLEPST